MIHPAITVGFPFADEERTKQGDAAAETMESGRAEVRLTVEEAGDAADAHPDLSANSDLSFFTCHGSTPRDVCLTITPSVASAEQELVSVRVRKCPECGAARCQQGDREGGCPSSSSSRDRGQGASAKGKGKAQGGGPEEDSSHSLPEIVHWSPKAADDSFDSLAEDGPTCRICFDGPTETDPLFRACACKGSVAYVHHDCLSKWASDSSRVECELCHSYFRIPEGIKPFIPKTAILHKVVLKNGPGWRREERRDQERVCTREREREREGSPP